MKNNEFVGRGLVKSKKVIEINNPKGNYEVTDITLSIKRMVHGNPEIILVPIEAWGDVSKLCNDIEVGDMVEITGYFKNKKWQNKENVEVSKNLIVAEDIERV